MIKVAKSLSRYCSNDEYTTFGMRFHSLTSNYTASELGIPDSLLDEYRRELDLLTNIISQSRISDLTARIGRAKTVRDQLVTYLMGTIALSRKAPLDATAAAAVHLYNVTKPYISIQRLSSWKETSQIDSLILDLNKVENSPAVVILHLNEAVEKLADTNNEYKHLFAQRLEQNTASRLEAGKTVRTRMDRLYDTITQLSFVKSIADPTPRTAQYIASLNAIIGETNAAFRQRVALQKAQKAKHATVVGTGKGIAIHHLPIGEPYRIADIADRTVAQGTSGGALTDIAARVGVYWVEMQGKRYEVVVQ